MYVLYLRRSVLNWCIKAQCRKRLDFCVLPKRFKSTTHYETLGITPSASQKEIKSAYIKLCKLKHPDRNPLDKDGHKNFIAINGAYEVLSNQTERRLYDSTLNQKPDQFYGYTQHPQYGAPRYKNYKNNQNSWSSESENFDTWSARTRAQREFRQKQDYKDWFSKNTKANPDWQSEFEKWHTNLEAEKKRRADQIEWMRAQGHARPRRTYTIFGLYIRMILFYCIFSAIGRIFSSRVEQDHREMKIPHNPEQHPQPRNGVADNRSYRNEQPHPLSKDPATNEKFYRNQQPNRDIATKDRFYRNEPIGRNSTTADWLYRSEKTS